MLCKVCEPRVPGQRGNTNEERTIKAFTCKACGAEQARDEFWPSDIMNRVQNRGLSCKTCEPTPPGERKRRR